MSDNILERFFHRRYRNKSKKFKQNVIKNVSHLYMNGRKLDEIKPFTCSQLKIKVLYLHNNSLTAINNLDEFIHLTHLYLQWNRITAIDNLHRLRQLKKLYLGYNCIGCLEGIEHLNELEELHVERQQLDINPFRFDLISLHGVSGSLRVLNISGLGLLCIDFLEHLPNLIELIAIDNLFVNINQITGPLKYLEFLRVAEFSGCPVQVNDIHYRSKIILASHSLVILDKKPINEINRQFFENFDKVNAKRKQKLKMKSVEPINEAVDIDLFILFIY